MESDSPLKANMFSRLGKSCNEQTSKLEKKDNVFLYKPVIIHRY